MSWYPQLTLAVPRFGHSLIAGTIESFNLFGSRIKSAPLTASQFAPYVSISYIYGTVLLMVSTITTRQVRAV